MVFEQLIGNALEQLAHTADLFSLDPAIAHTYFVKAFDETIIKGYGDLVDPSKLDPTSIEAMIETVPEFEARRNTFLDHLMARFGEEFSEYALLLTNAAGEAIAQPRLIENKIAFLKRYPEISHDRAKAFNYTVTPCAPCNYPGIKKRISLLLGYPDLTFSWTVGAPAGDDYPVSYRARRRQRQALAGRFGDGAGGRLVRRQGGRLSRAHGAHDPFGCLHHRGRWRRSSR